MRAHPRWLGLELVVLSIRLAGYGGGNGTAAGQHDDRATAARDGFVLWHHSANDGWATATSVAVG